MKVLLPQDISDAGKDFLSEKGYDIRVSGTIDPKRLLIDASPCDAVLLRTAVMTKELMQAAKGLKIIAKHGVGVDNVDLAAAEELGIWVTNTPLANSASVAEHVLMLMLECVRNAYAVTRAFRGEKRDFNVRNRYVGIELSGKTLGIIGLGRIGKLLGQKASGGLGMRVLGYDPYLPEGALLPGVDREKSIEAVLREADFVTLHMPATPTTVKSLTIRQFEQMKETAYFINASRGEIVAEEDLIFALEQNIIKGAALDVFAQEPPQKDNPLFAMDNVILSPHNAALTREALDRMGLHAAMSIDEVLSGRTPSWPVNHPKNPR